MEALPWRKREMSKNVILRTSFKRATEKPTGALKDDSQNGSKTRHRGTMTPTHTNQPVPCTFREQVTLS